MKFYIEIMQKLPLFVALFVAAAATIAGDYFGKLWSINPKPTVLILALLGYFLSGFFYIPTLLKSGLVVSSIIWSLLTIIGFLVVGLIVFKEELTLLQIIASSIGLISLILFSFSL